MQRKNIRGFYHITHIDNLESILERGILSHKKTIDEKIDYKKIYDASIVSSRKEKITPAGRSLWEYANFYFQSRNPMMYRVICEKNAHNIAVIEVKNKILDINGCYITTGNAASYETEIIQPIPKNMARISKEDIELIFWKEFDGTKRRIMAECLVPDCVPPSNILSIYISDPELKKDLDIKLSKYNIQIVANPDTFFKSQIIEMLTDKFYLVRGDMFFSRFQTLTISVNTVGVMGAGLASRTKYQFPDVYVYYQDLCRKKELKMGEPHLYKREVSSDLEIADDPSSFKRANGETWFLLFPTKNHWKQESDIKGIEKGLQWLEKNYKKHGITKLAIPALGCGLGWLSWNVVGPMLCKYLSRLEIPVWLYLPAEKKIGNDELSKEFLLGE